MLPYWLMAGLTLAVALTLVLRAGRLPSLDDRVVSTAFEDTEDTTLGLAVAHAMDVADAEPDASGVHVLPDPRNALAARIALADAAERSLDLQYYIWRLDVAGHHLIDALVRAADRGVRVRLLLDDNNTTGLDAELAVLDEHPFIEVRLFNPFMHRRVRALGFLTDFQRLNRRMHNKSFTADNQATIIGGRNVGDEYFGAEGDLAFIDLDVLAVGPVVQDVSRKFDAYWQSRSSYPASRILPKLTDAKRDVVRRDAESARLRPQAVAYADALRATPFLSQLQRDALPLVWSRVTVFSDDPAKGLEELASKTQLLRRMADRFGAAEKEMFIVSPYFVPTKEGVAALAAFADQGVDVEVLTNSFAATDVAVVHAAYVSARVPLLRVGVRLFEMRRQDIMDVGLRDRGLTGSSGSSLHAKTFGIDGSRLFIGSFNFDPRSVRHNTEMGFIIKSPELTRQLSAAFRARVPQDAYELRLDENGRLVWLEQTANGEVRHTTEPNTTVFTRLIIRVLSWLPIQGLV